jgi:hypothetical protein
MRSDADFERELDNLSFAAQRDLLMLRLAHLYSLTSHVPRPVPRDGLVSSLHRNSGTASSPALASLTDTSRLHDKQPVASHRGYAYDEPQAILHRAVVRLAKCER